MEQETAFEQPNREDMDVGCGNAKTICSICYDDLKPIVEDLQSISICGHVFHELCLQQWFEYSLNAKKYSCPMCKQACTAKDVGRLYFQSAGDANDSFTQKRSNCAEADPEELQIEAKRLELKISGLNSALERQGKDLKELKEEFYICQDQLKKEVILRKEVLKQKTSISELLHIKSEELDKSTIECKRLQERSMALAKELAAFKLVSELDLDEEDITKLASLGSGANSKDTIDILRKSLVMRNRSYKELMTKCNLLGRGEARSSKKLEKAKEKINTLKTRVQELEKSIEAKDNEALRVLKYSKEASIQEVQKCVCCKCSMASENNKPDVSRDDSGSNVSLINDSLSLRERKKFQFLGNVSANERTLVDASEKTCSSIDKNTSESPQVEHGHLNPNLGEEKEMELRSYCFLAKSSCIMSSKNAAERATHLVNNLSSTANVNNMGKISSGDECMPIVVEDSAKCEPIINIMKECSRELHLKKPGDTCFSGGLLGPDGSSRYLGRWCKRGPDGSVSRQGLSSELIAVGADGRGGKIKVLRSQNEFSLSNRTMTAGAKRCKYRGDNMQIEHFFGRVNR